ncbi:MAG: hypothetical protein AB3N17_02960 [Tateyamaria sp.]
MTEEVTNRARLDEASDATVVGAYVKAWVKPTQVAVSVGCLICLWLIFGARFRLLFEGQLHFSELGTTGRLELTNWIMLACLTTASLVFAYEALAPRKITLRARELLVEDAIGRCSSFPIKDVKRVDGRLWRSRVRWYIWILDRRRPVKLWNPAWHNQRRLLKAMFSVRPDLATEENSKLLSKGN